jgi:hypothetical protein
VQRANAVVLIGDGLWFYWWGCEIVGFDMWVCVVCCRFCWVVMLWVCGFIGDCCGFVGLSLGFSVRLCWIGCEFLWDFVG